jgi:hypothetical protein
MLQKGPLFGFESNNNKQGLLDGAFRVAFRSFYAAAIHFGVKQGAIYGWRFFQPPPAEVLDELERLVALAALEVAAAERALIEYRTKNPPRTQKIRRRKKLKL